MGRKKGFRKSSCAERTTAIKALKTWTPPKEYCRLCCRLAAWRAALNLYDDGVFKMYIEYVLPRYCLG
jgi:hypothetical protein